jgi:hypothetical protein
MERREKGRPCWPKAAREELQRAFTEAEQAASMSTIPPSFVAEPLDGGCLLYRPFARAY